MRQILAGGDSVSTKIARRLLGRRRTGGGIAVALAAVLALGGCADGTHPGAAAVVGDTEISVQQVDKTSRAVATALGQEVPPAEVVGGFVRTELVDQTMARRSISITPAETAKALEELRIDPQVVARLNAGGPQARDFLDDFVRSTLGTAKLGGGRSAADNQALAAGRARLLEEAKSIDVVISPRFGKWTGEQLTADSGSLSAESDQTKAKREAADRERQRQQQEQPQG